MQNMSPSITRHLTDKAVESALFRRWNDAVKYNLDLLALNPKSVPTLNRLAKAYVELGDFPNALTTYQQVLSLDRFNQIALKNITKLGVRQTKNDQNSNHDICIDTNFIEEPGKTRTLHLVRLADNQVLSSLQPGQIVSIVAKNHTVSVTTETGQHIGALTDDLAFQLKNCLTAGNSYQATLKSLTPKSVCVFIKEKRRSSPHHDVPSFTL